MLSFLTSTDWRAVTLHSAQVCDLRAVNISMQVVQLTADPHENLRLDAEAPVHAPLEGEVLVNLLIRCHTLWLLRAPCNCIWSWMCLPRLTAPRCQACQPCGYLWADVKRPKCQGRQADGAWL